MSGMQKRKRGSWTAGVALLAGAMAFAPQAGRTQTAPLPTLNVRRVTGVATLPAVSTLLAKARPIARFRGKENWFIHQWITAESLLMVHAEKDAPRVEAEIVSASTGIHQPLAGLNRFLDHVDKIAVLSCEVSPDGHWFLEHDRMGTNVMRLDGSERRYIEDDGFGVSVTWLSDSEHWLNEFTAMGRPNIEYKGVSLSSLHPGRQKEPVFVDKNHAWEHPAEEALTAAYTMSSVLECYAAPVREMNGYEVDNHRATRLVVRRRSLLSANKSRRVGGFLLPRAGMVVEAAFSPTRRRLAWLLWASGRLTLYTGALNGANRAIIGSFACKCPRWRFGSSNNAEFPAGLSWLPDGRSLSFVYRNTVYTVPAS